MYTHFIYIILHTLYRHHYTLYWVLYVGMHIQKLQYTDHYCTLTNHITLNCVWGHDTMYQLTYTLTASTSVAVNAIDFVDLHNCVHSFRFKLCTFRFRLCTFRFRLCTFKVCNINSYDVYSLCMARWTHYYYNNNIMEVPGAHCV